MPDQVWHGDLGDAVVNPLANLVFVVLLCVMPVAYLLALGWFGLTGRLIRAGVASLMIAVAPVFWLFVFGPEDLPPGAGFILMICTIPAALSLLVLVAGLIVFAVRGLLRMRTGSAQSGMSA
jgi:hypothetical protein